MKSLLPALIYFLIVFETTAQVTRIAGVENPGPKWVYKDKLMFPALTVNGWYLHYYNDTAIHNTNMASVAMSGLTFGNVTAEVNGNLYYYGVNSNGMQLMVWDGVNTPSLATNIKVPTTQSHSIQNLIAHDGKLYFTVFYWVNSGGQAMELWMHDPGANITRKIPLMPGGQSIFSPYSLTILGEKIFFSAVDGNRSFRLYYYDPAVDDIILAPNFEPMSDIISCLWACYDKLYYLSKTTSHGTELYCYDGKNIPVRVTDINPGSCSSFTWGLNHWETPKNYLIGFKGNVFFKAESTSNKGEQLYKYDPRAPLSSTNPSQVGNINAARWIISAPEFIEFDGKLYFYFNDSTHGDELWVYDGINDPWLAAEVNTDPVSHSTSYGYGQPRLFSVYRNNLFFTAYTRTNSWELYRLGWPSGVQNINRVKDLKVYPVPTSEKFNFEIDLKDHCSFTISLTDITGREVFNSGVQSHNAGKTTVQANVAQLAAGSYLYRITTNDGATLASGKVIKQ